MMSEKERTPQDSAKSHPTTEKRGGLIAAWVAILLTVTGLVVQQFNIDQQLELTRETIRMDWRPQAKAKFADPMITLAYLSGDNDESPMTLLSIDSVEIGSPLYHGVRYLGFDIKRDVIVHNVGKSPMWITGSTHSSLSEPEWLGMGKSSEALYDSIRAWNAISRNSVDIPVFPSETHLIDSTGIIRRMPRSVFDSLRTTSDRIVFYPYTFLEYTDKYRQAYNMVIVYHAIVKCSYANRKLEVLEQPYLILEQYRLDIGIPSPLEAE